MPARILFIGDPHFQVSNIPEVDMFIEKLEKFMSGKPIAEQEIGYALLQEVVAYAETSISRRKYLLHYFWHFKKSHFKIIVNDSKFYS